MSYIPTVEQIANVLTKGLYKRQFDYLISKLAMEDIQANLRGSVGNRKKIILPRYGRILWDIIAVNI